MGADPTALAEPLRSSVLGLLNEAGGRVTVSSARRTTAEQIELRRQNCGTSQSDIYDKPSMSCRPPTARPGESAHERGLAVDFGGDLNLVKQLAGKYSLRATVSGEPWHYEHNATAGTGGGGDSDESGRPVTGLDKIGGAIANPGTPVKAAVNLATASASDLVPSWITDPAKAAVAVAQAILNPRTWLRVGGVIGGSVLAVTGVILLGRELGAPIPSVPTPATAAVRAVKARPKPPATPPKGPQ